MRTLQALAYIACNRYGVGVHTDTAYRRLRELILDGTYPAGSRLTELPPPPDLVTIVEPPTYEALEHLITRIQERY